MPIGLNAVDEIKPAKPARRLSLLGQTHGCFRSSLPLSCNNQIPFATLGKSVIR